MKITLENRLELIKSICERNQKVAEVEILDYQNSDIEEELQLIGTNFSPNKSCRNDLREFAFNEAFEGFGQGE
jgi:hypothetical protein